ncbi:response regulator [Tritonibacter horizontis]|uniref:Chemotaxis response regulator protein-glutamate methylesterase n=1 Tax=Tritonibacter horizontis TaxID=1768241 RepID=A0A132BUH8_9RHOB|nr:response regulator [Tritonibacter horizontis]KUP91944.1 chemotaxis response regulator protein-glutamate methylesterase [Tritonibacter horizontis]
MQYIPIKCLVVEDEEADRLMFKRVFRQFNRAGSVEFATSLANARNSLAVRKYDIIVLDNSLEDGKGADFILELSKNEELSPIPVVIVSDWPSPFMYAKAKSGNVLDVLTKDQFDVETLRRVMKAASLCD